MERQSIVRATAWGISLRSFREIGEIIRYVVDELLIVWLSVKLSWIMGKAWKGHLWNKP